MKEKFTFFWNGPFSNWHICKVVVNDQLFTSVEQYIMYSKAMIFTDFETAGKIMLTNDPREQKKLGRQVKNYDDDVWASMRFDIGYAGCYAKFSDNHKLKKLLLATYDTTLVEASPYDKIWGIGLDENHPDATIREKWQGENLLGQILMKVRQDIAYEIFMDSCS